MAEQKQDVNIRLRVLNEARGGVSSALSDLKMLERGAASAASTLNSIGGVLGVGVGFAGISAIIARGVQDFAQYEEALDSVDDALAAFGDRSEQSRTRAAAFATEISRAVHVSDEAVLSAQALGVTIGGLAGDELERATRAAVGLSKGLGIGLDAAMKAVSKAAVGSTKDLAKFGIVLDENATATEKYHAVLEKGEGLYAADAAGAATYTEQVDDLGRAFKGLSREIGSVVVAALSTGEETFLSRITNELKAVQTIIQWIKNNPVEVKKSKAQQRYDAESLINNMPGGTFQEWFTYIDERFSEYFNETSNRQDQTKFLDSQGKKKAEDLAIARAKVRETGGYTGGFDYADPQKLAAEFSVQVAVRAQEEARKVQASALFRDAAELTGKADKDKPAGQLSQEDNGADALIAKREKLLSIQTALAGLGVAGREAEQKSIADTIALLGTEIQKRQEAAGLKVSAIVNDTGDDLKRKYVSDVSKVDALLASKDLTNEDRARLAVHKEDLTTSFLMERGYRKQAEIVKKQDDEQRAANEIRASLDASELDMRREKLELAKSSGKATKEEIAEIERSIKTGQINLETQEKIASLKRLMADATTDEQRAAIQSAIESRARIGNERVQAVGSAPIEPIKTDLAQIIPATLSGRMMGVANTPQDQLRADNEKQRKILKDVREEARKQKEVMDDILKSLTGKQLVAVAGYE